MDCTAFIAHLSAQIDNVELPSSFILSVNFYRNHDAPARGGRSVRTRIFISQVSKKYVRKNLEILRCSGYGEGVSSNGLAL